MILSSPPFQSLATLLRHAAGSVGALATRPIQAKSCRNAIRALDAMQRPFDINLDGAPRLPLSEALAVGAEADVVDDAVALPHDTERADHRCLPTPGA